MRGKAPSPQSSPRGRGSWKNPLSPASGEEGQGEGVCHDHRGLPAFETFSETCPPLDIAVAGTLNLNHSAMRCASHGRAGTEPRME